MGQMYHLFILEGNVPSFFNRLVMLLLTVQASYVLFFLQVKSWLFTLRDKSHWKAKRAFVKGT